MEVFTIALLLFLGFAVVIVTMSMKWVPQGRNYTVEMFGKYTRTLPPGLGFIFPVIARVGAKMNMMEQVMDIPTQEVITRDNAMVSVDGVVFFQILDAASAGAGHRQSDHDEHSYRDGVDGSG